MSGGSNSAANPYDYDVNHDGVVNVLDISLTAEQWQSTAPAVLAIYDFNGSGMVDIGDIMLDAAHMNG